MRVIVCDDSSQDIEVIRLYINSLIEYSNQYEYYNNSEIFLKEYNKGKGKEADLYILNEEMSGADGITVAREIRKRDARALIVFLTSHTKYMADIFEVVTFDYIQKPITKERLHRLLAKAETYLDMTSQNFSFDYRRKHYRIKSGDIFYFEKQGRQLIIHTRCENYLANMNLNELWTKLSEGNFAAVHGSFIVNLKYIKTISGDKVLLEDGTQLHISRSCRKSLLEKHLDFVERY